MPVVVPPHQERWSTIRILDIQDESPTAGPVHHRALHDQPITLLRPHRWLPSSAAAVPGCTRSILAPNGAAEPTTSARRLGTQPQVPLEPTVVDQRALDGEGRVDRRSFDRREAQRLSLIHI